MQRKLSGCAITGAGCWRLRLRRGDQLSQLEPVSVPPIAFVWLRASRYLRLSMPSPSLTATSCFSLDVQTMTSWVYREHLRFNTRPVRVTTLGMFMYCRYSMRRWGRDGGLDVDLQPHVDMRFLGVEAVYLPKGSEPHTNQFTAPHSALICRPSRTVYDRSMHTPNLTNTMLPKFAHSLNKLIRQTIIGHLPISLIGLPPLLNFFYITFYL
ncbi:hypothetical protein GGR57DRAFT_416587 [Xylariaceae sp. FL1272]|nr:hypothetical protein GGR57DRAFT_416587 [Xylariaceae sp. FL1272]